MNIDTRLWGMWIGGFLIGFSLRGLIASYLANRRASDTQKEKPDTDIEMSTKQLAKLWPGPKEKL